MPYVDGFVIPIPKKNVAKYRKMATKAGKVWMEHGALEYRECIGDELSFTDPASGKTTTTFPRTLRLKKDETAILAWIVYRDKAHRDRVNRLVMKDPRIASMMDPKAMPFDEKRMNYGGFKVVVDL